jgi:hypothetical protein
MCVENLAKQKREKKISNVINNVVIVVVVAFTS